MNWLSRNQELKQTTVANFCRDWARLIDFGDKPSVALAHLAQNSEDSGLRRALNLVMSDVIKNVEEITRAKEKRHNRSESIEEELSKRDPNWAENKELLDGILDEGLKYTFKGESVPDEVVSKLADALGIDKQAALEFFGPSLVDIESEIDPEVAKFLEELEGPEEKFNPPDLAQTQEDLMILSAFKNREALFGKKFTGLVCINSDHPSSPFQQIEYALPSGRKGVAGYLECVGDLLIQDSISTPETHRATELKIFAFALGTRLCVGMPIIKALASTKEILSPDFGKVIDDLVLRFDRNYYEFKGNFEAHPEFFPQEFVAIAAEGLSTGNFDNELLRFAMSPLCE